MIPVLELIVPLAEKSVETEGSTVEPHSTRNSSAGSAAGAIGATAVPLLALGRRSKHEFYSRRKCWKVS